MAFCFFYVVDSREQQEIWSERGGMISDKGQSENKTSLNCFTKQLYKKMTVLYQHSLHLPSCHAFVIADIALRVQTRQPKKYIHQQV